METQIVPKMESLDIEQRCRIFVEENKQHYIIDDENIRYQMQALLGKGGFAKVYRLSYHQNGKNKVCAGKIIQKIRINRSHDKDRVTREVAIHRRMKHENVVEFVKFFEDKENVYLILEYCGSMTLSGILKNRKVLTEPEARYYLKQLVAGCQHIHSLKVVHRDLKLSNLFVNEQMRLKIGDFGLSAFMENAEKKESVCGTPNYISPEVIAKKGHSYPVDVWSIGCVLFAMIKGRPPFETDCLKDTYTKILKPAFEMPESASDDVKCLIAKCLRKEPKERPSLVQIMADSFLTKGYIPSHLPILAMQHTPDFNDTHTPNDSMPYLLSRLSNQQIIAEGGMDLAQNVNQTLICNSLLGALISAHNILKEKQEKENPDVVPGGNCLWITKWVDYSHKFGFGFQLSNRVYGACFKNGLSTTMSPDMKIIGIRDPEGLNAECPYEEIIDKYPAYIEVKTVKHFVKYMNDMLIVGGDLDTVTDRTALSQMYMLRWHRSMHSITMCLASGTVQVNFFVDHSKLIVSLEPSGEYQLLYINPRRQASVYNLSDIIKHGCTLDIKLRLHFLILQVASLLRQPTPTLL